MKMEFDAFIKGIKEKLDKPLPGVSSQLKMAGLRRLTRDGEIVVPHDVRKAAVLALFYPAEQQINMVFIKRTEYTGVHSGQISFPGGGWEQDDRDLVDTALREAEEEIGVDRNSVIAIGMLTDLFIPPSNFLVTPVVGYTSGRPDFIPDRHEVDRILEIPLEELMDELNVLEKDITIFPAVTLKVPCFYIDGNVIWGATAMILSELIDVIRSES
jgi:8-oxo-dGTP pyrophosphatase MutT (NUDIX family)